ncbi:hypothetical protein L596_020726 [Steinernema carpocapsae]|nr:hypothetical protein L596_020726 [Steinernema carpocapsae]
MSNYLAPLASLPSTPHKFPVSDLQRQRECRERHRRQHSFDDSLLYLGPMDNICQFCGAYHFAGVQNCCEHGKVFIPPMRKLWEPLQSLYFDHNFKGRSQFLENILSYNTLLSMASSTHDRVLQNPHGVQSVKIRGPVHHMPSALYPNDPNRPRYGNLYVYDPQRATDYRMNETVSRYVKEDLLKTLGERVAQNNVFARAYRHMDELIKEQQEHGFPPNALRMKLIDARDVDQDELIAHPGVYEAPRCGEMVSVYFTCGPEMDIPQRGYIVYPKKDNHTPFEIRFYLPFIDAFCFPLLYGYGEHSWRSGIPYQTEKKQYFERMVEVKKELASKGINIDWSEEEHIHDNVPPGAQVQMEEIQRMLIEDLSKDGEDVHSSLQFDEDSDDSQENVLEDDYIDDPVETTDSVKIVERGGELYPQRTNANGSEEQMRLLLHDTNDSGDELVRSNN